MLSDPVCFGKARKGLGTDDRRSFKEGYGQAPNDRCGARGKIDSLPGQAKPGFPVCHLDDPGLQILPECYSALPGFLLLHNNEMR